MIQLQPIKQCNKNNAIPNDVLLNILRVYEFAKEEDIKKLPNNLICLENGDFWTTWTEVLNTRKNLQKKGDQMIKINYKLVITPAISPKKRYKIENALRLIGFEIFGGGTDVITSKCDITFTEKSNNDDEIKSSFKTHTMKMLLFSESLTKEVYYYIRDSENNNRLAITICLLRDEDGNTGKGTALCSKKDRPNKKTGRVIAKRRALQALEKKISSLRIRLPRIYPATLLETNYYLKSYYNAALTKYENSLLNN